MGEGEGINWPRKAQRGTNKKGGRVCRLGPNSAFYFLRLFVFFVANTDWSGIGGTRSSSHPTTSFLCHFATLPLLARLRPCFVDELSILADQFAIDENLPAVS
jgi:hypothetical protein